MLGLPNIRRDLGLETDMQRDMRLMQQGDVMGQTLSQGLPAPIANLSAGILRNIPGITDNVRQLGVQSGMSGLQTESELFEKALSGYDGTPAGQARVVQSLTAINPEYGAMMANKLRTQNLQEAQVMASIGYNQAQSAKLNDEVSSNQALRSTIIPLLPDSRFSNIPIENINNMGKEGLRRLFDQLTEKRDLDLYQGTDDQGNLQSVFLNRNDNKFYDSQDLTRILTPDEVPEMIYRASVQASDPDDLSGGTAAVRELTNAGVATAGLFQTITRAIDLVETNETSLSTAGGLSAFATSMAFEITAMKRLFNLGVSKSEGDLNINSTEIQDAVAEYGFVGEGRAAAELNSLIIGLAYGAAAAQEGGNTISNTDVANRMKQLGANQADPVTFITNLRNFADNAWVQYEERYKRLNNDETPGDNFNYDYIRMTPQDRADRRLFGL